MKRLLIVLLVLAFTLAMTSAALAAPPTSWNPPGPTYRDPILPPDPSADTPHESYVAGGDECEICHSPHQAGSGGTSYKLLRAATRDAACDYCHLGAGAKSGIEVYQAGKTGQNGHEITAVPGGVAPDSDVAIPDLDCFDCHSPHGAKTIAGSKILKEDPAANSGAAGSETEFCADCHNKNHDTAPDGDSHVMKSATGSKVANTDSTDCDDCHTAPKAGKYPHTSVGDALLKDAATRDAIDGVCLDCHGSTGKKVGEDY